MEQIDYNKPWYRIENEGGIVAEGNGTINEWVIREWAGLDKMNSYPVWDESIHTGSWRGVCVRCGLRPRYYHEPTKRLFDLCAVCGLEAIKIFLDTPMPVPGVDTDDLDPNGEDAEMRERSWARARFEDAKRARSDDGAYDE